MAGMAVKSMNGEGWWEVYDGQVRQRHLSLKIGWNFTERGSDMRSWWDLTGSTWHFGEVIAKIWTQIWTELCIYRKDRHGEACWHSVVMQSASGQTRDLGSSKYKWPEFCFWFVFSPQQTRGIKKKKKKMVGKTVIEWIDLGDILFKTM